MENNHENARGYATPLLFLLALVLALVAYLLPWVIATNSAMTLNAFDLAEWTSLHPSQRHALPPLITPLLLRAQLPIIAALVALWASSPKERLLAILCVFLLAVAQLPPWEFLRDSGDANYQQQAALALATIIFSIGLPGLRRLMPANFQPFVVILIAILGIVSAILGQSQALDLYHVTLEQGETGGGLWICLAAYAAISLNALWGFRRRL